MAEDEDQDQMGDRRKSLMSHEITRARLRLLTPITEEATSPRAKLGNKNMVAITDKLDLKQSAENNQIPLDVLKQLQDMQQDGDPGEITSDPHDLKTLVEGYLNDPRYLQGRRPPQRRALRPTLYGHRPVHCECCAQINRENRERRMDQYPEQYGYWTENAPPVELIPYGNPAGRVPVLGKYSSELVPVRGQLPTLPNPGSEPVDADGPHIQVLYPNYEGTRPMNWDSNRAGQYDSMLFPTQPGAGQHGGYDPSADERAGSALAMYPYLPRNMHNYNSSDYDIYRLGLLHPDHSSNYERYLMEDIMNAAQRYDRSMHRLEGKIDELTPRSSNGGHVRFKGRFDEVH